LGASTVSSTVSVPPFRKETVSVAVVEPPACTRRLSGLSERMKSGRGVTLTLTVIVCDLDPLAPVTWTA